MESFLAAVPVHPLACGVYPYHITRLMVAHTSADRVWTHVADMVCPYMRCSSQRVFRYVPREFLSAMRRDMVLTRTHATSRDDDVCTQSLSRRPRLQSSA